MCFCLRCFLFSTLLNFHLYISFVSICVERMWHRVSQVSCFSDVTGCRLMQTLFSNEVFFGQRWKFSFKSQFISFTPSMHRALCSLFKSELCAFKVCDAWKYLGVSNDCFALNALWHQLMQFYFDLFPVHSAPHYFASIRCKYLIVSICIGFCSPFKRIISPFFHLTIYSQFDQQQHHHHHHRPIEVTLTENQLFEWLKTNGNWTDQNTQFKLQMLLYCFGKWQRERASVSFAIWRARERESWANGRQPKTMEWLKFQLNCHSTCTSKYIPLHTLKRTHSRTQTHTYTRNENRHKSHRARSSKS